MVFGKLSQKLPASGLTPYQANVNRQLKAPARKSAAIEPERIRSCSSKPAPTDRSRRSVLQTAPEGCNTCQTKFDIRQEPFWPRQQTSSPKHPEHSAASRASR